MIQNNIRQNVANDTISNLSLILGFFALLLTFFGNKYYNFNPFLGLIKVNNFLDNIISPSDIVIVVLIALVLVEFFWGVLKRIKNPAKNTGIAMNTSHNETASQLGPYSNQNIQIIATTILIFFAVLKLGLSPNLSFFFEICRWIILVYLSAKHWNSNKILILSLLTFGMFDHGLWSNSLILIIAYFWDRILGNIYYDNLFKTYIGITFLASVFQVIAGKSLGLLYFGEPVLDLNTLGIARQNVPAFLSNIINQDLILRAYGLTRHSNILGFIGVLGILFSFNNKKPVIMSHDNTNHTTKNILKNMLRTYQSTTNQIFQKNFLQKNLNKIFLLASILITLLSLSRICWIIATVIIYLNITPKIIIPKVVKILILVLSTTIIGTFSLTKPDHNRILDWNNWWNAIRILEPNEILFGVGYYPEFLASRFSELPSWQWQPVHNIMASFGVSFGIIGILGVISILIITHQKS
jgi:hypothetical protein